MKLRLSIIGSWLVWFGTGAFESTLEADATLRFRLAAPHLIMVPVCLNGLGPFPFLVDTAASSTILDSGLARQLRMVARDRVVLETPAGNLAVSRGQVPRVALGAKAKMGLEVLWMDLSVLRSRHPEIRGVLGQNFLSFFNFMLSYREQQIKFDDDRSLQSSLRGLAVPVRRSAGRLLVRAATPPMGLVLDSGAQGVVLFENSRDGVSKIRFPAVGPLGTLTSAAGTRTGRYALLPRLEIGDQTLSGLEVVMISVNRQDPREENGLLPLWLFHTIYFDHENGSVMLNPSLVD